VPTDRRPTYEGRVLPHPAEEAADQGLGFDLGTRGAAGCCGRWGSAR
jgi:hypothetical protein